MSIRISEGGLSAEPRPTLVKVTLQPIADRAFWLMVREGLLLLVKAVERRHLSGLKKCEIAETRKM